MFKCINCGIQKDDVFCCENNISICLDCCNDDCDDSIEYRKE
jgi:hypothetical protein